MSKRTAKLLAPAKAKTAPPKRVPQPASVEDDDGIPM